MHLHPLFALSVLLVSGCGTPGPQASKLPEEPAAKVRTPGSPLVFEPAPEWIVESPTSGMRKAQYRLPRAEGDAEDAECVVYYFGAQSGGGLDANVERWCSQFEQVDGRDSKEVLARNERTVGGMPVHEVRLSDTYVAETAPGSGVRVNKPGFRMLAAIVESDHGAYYVKLVGPEATVQTHTTAFLDFIGRIQLAVAGRAAPERACGGSSRPTSTTARDPSPRSGAK